LVRVQIKHVTSAFQPYKVCILARLQWLSCSFCSYSSYTWSNRAWLWWSLLL